MKKCVLLSVCLGLAVVSVLYIAFKYVVGAENETNYNLGSNAGITYKENENKVYYTRTHYSSGSNIRYYTQSFVISLGKASENDDLSDLGNKGKDYAIMYTVTTDGSSVKADESDKTLEFYWYDSEGSDDGYITTTYVLDGSLFVRLLDEAAHNGVYGEDIYIHHVFAVNGGSNDDSWHRENHVENNSPYYKYSDLMKLSWNNSQATHESQKACLNIPVPFKRVYDVNTAYYNEYGEIIKQDNEKISGKKQWKKSAVTTITGSDGKRYKTVTSGNVKDVYGNTMWAVYVWNTDPYLSGSFPNWNLEADTALAGSDGVFKENANVSSGNYTFKPDEKRAIEVILYIPVVENSPDPTPTPSMGPPITPTATPSVTPSAYPTTKPSVTPTSKPTSSPSPTPIGEPEVTDTPQNKEITVTVKYFVLDEKSGSYIWLKSENKRNRSSDNGKFYHNEDCSVQVSEYVSTEGKTYLTVRNTGILYGDNSGVLISGKRDFYDLYEEIPSNGVVGGYIEEYEIDEDCEVSFYTDDTGKYYTLYMLCLPADNNKKLVLRFFDSETGDILAESVTKDFFENPLLTWHGINGKLVWALPIEGIYAKAEAAVENTSFLPVFSDPEFAKKITGECDDTDYVHFFDNSEGRGRSMELTYCGTCGKIREVFDYKESPWDDSARRQILDDGYRDSAFHTYNIYEETGNNALKAGFAYRGRTPEYYSTFESSYSGSKVYHYDYDSTNDTLWIEMDSNPDNGDTFSTRKPEKNAGVVIGILYIPCTRKKDPLKISIISDNLKYVQYINADIDIPQLVTGSSDSPGSVGNEHITSVFSADIEGYDENVRVLFPFDVYTENGVRIRGGTWNDLYPSYYVPADVQEGSHIIRAASFDKEGNILEEAETMVEISGKMYGLELMDINSEAYDCKDVFHTDGDIKYFKEEKYENGIFDTVFDAKKRYSYGAGLLNELGLTKTNLQGIPMSGRFTLPLVDGAGIRKEHTGMLKSGYTWTFCLKTSGSRMADPVSKVIITPEFTHVSQNGERRKVNILYTGTKGGEIVNYLNAAGSFEALPVLGYEEESERKLWTFKYMLPDKWVCTPVDFDLESYLMKNGACSYREEMFIKEGYVAVNFRIEAYDKEGNLIMTYSNTEENVSKGMCDMWKTEGFKTERTDCYGQTYSLEEGDVILLRIPGSTFDRTKGYADPPTNISEENTIIRINPSYVG